MRFGKPPKTVFFIGPLYFLLAIFFIIIIKLLLIIGL